VDNVFNAGESIFIDSGSSKRHSLPFITLNVASLVDELGDSFSGRITVSDEWLDNTDHVPGGFVELHEHSVVELSQSKQLQDLLRLGGKLVDTSDSSNKGDLGLSLNVERASSLGISLGLN
jgi:hypothetical protein